VSPICRNRVPRLSPGPNRCVYHEPDWHTCRGAASTVAPTAAHRRAVSLAGVHVALACRWAEATAGASGPARGLRADRCPRPHTRQLANLPTRLPGIRPLAQPVDRHPKPNHPVTPATGRRSRSTRTKPQRRPTADPAPMAARRGQHQRRAGIQPLIVPALPPCVPSPEESILTRNAIKVTG
jgi:hypothetical protein